MKENDRYIEITPDEIPNNCVNIRKKEKGKKTKDKKIIIISTKTNE